MAPLDAFSDLSIRGSGQAIGGARARREVTATSQTQRRAWASRRSRCSFLCSCDLVPGIDRQLAGDQRRAGAITVLDDLHEVAPLVGREPVWAPVIKDQQIGLGKRAEQTREAAVSVGQFEIGKEARHTCVMQ